MEVRHRRVAGVPDLPQLLPRLDAVTDGDGRRAAPHVRVRREGAVAVVDHDVVAQDEPRAGRLAEQTLDRQHVDEGLPRVAGPVVAPTVAHPHHGAGRHREDRLAEPRVLLGSARAQGEPQDLGRRRPGHPAHVDRGVLAPGPRAVAGELLTRAVERRPAAADRWRQLDRAEVVVAGRDTDEERQHDEPDDHRRDAQEASRWADVRRARHQDRHHVHHQVEAEQEQQHVPQGPQARDRPSHVYPRVLDVR